MSTENHNHITRDIKKPGECYSCDRYWATTQRKAEKAYRNIIYSTLEILEERGASEALRYLENEAIVRNITHYED